MSTLEKPELIAAYNEAQRKLAAREKRMREVAENMREVMRIKHLQAADPAVSFDQVEYWAAKLLEGLGAE